MQVTQTVNDAALPVAFQTLNLTAELRNNRAELGWTIRLTNNGQFDGQVQVTDPQGRRSLGGNVNIRNFKPHLYPWGKSSGDGECQLASGW